MKKTILFFLGAGMLVACKHTELPKEQLSEVKVVRAQQTKQESERNYTFLSQPYRTSELSFRVGGPILLFNIQNGQFFQKGALIAAIDDRDFLIRCQRAEAIYKQAEADYERISNLYKKGNISGTNYEKAKADYEKTKADYTEAVNDLKDTKMYAPFDGYVQQIHAERFQDIKPSAPVVTFIDLSKIKVEAYVPEDMALSFRKKNTPACNITFNALQGRTFSPSEVYVTQSATNNNISYLLTAILENENNDLFGGMTGTFSIPFIPHNHSASNAGVVIPQTAVCHNPQIGSYVWKVDENNQVNKKPVTVGRLKKNDLIEVVSGLSVGEQVAVTRLSYLSENEKINTKEQSSIHS